MSVTFLQLPVAAELTFFGYSAVLCGLDDPHDAIDKTDYTDEVARFTNINQVCLTSDVDINAHRLQRAVRWFTPLLDVSPVFFEMSDGRMRPTQNTDYLIQILTDSIAASQVLPEKLVFYLADEPTLHGLTPQDISNAAARLKGIYPNTPIAVIEALHPAGLPAIPNTIDYWGFNAYAIPDPAHDAQCIPSAFIRQIGTVA